MSEISIDKGYKFVDVNEYDVSLSSIRTEGLVGCYAFLIDGHYNQLPFCFLYHCAFSTNPDTTSSISDILIDWIEELVEDIKKSSLAKLVSSAEITLKDNINNLSLFICGGIKQQCDHIRLAFQLLQRQLDGDLIDKFKSDSDEFYLCQELNLKTTIVSAVSYLLPDSIEDMAADEGLDGDDIIQPPSVWLQYDCCSKVGVLGVIFESSAGIADLARMNINLSSNNESYMWQPLSNDIVRFYSMIEHDEDQLRWFNQALGNILRDDAETGYGIANILKDSIEIDV